MGTVLVCNGTHPETLAMVGLYQGQRRIAVPMTLRPAGQFNVTVGVVDIEALPPGMCALEYRIGGVVVAKTWVRVDE